MKIEFQTIKPFNGSQNNAFEELICQLARDESIPNKTEFYRVAAPDGGVEAYCVLGNGEESGWQARTLGRKNTSDVWHEQRRS